MTHEPHPPLSVAHFRRQWFIPTETFIYHTICGAETTRPVLIGYTMAHPERFPVPGPTVALYPRGTLAGWWHHVRGRLRADPFGPGFRRAETFRALQTFEVRVLHAHFGHTGWMVLPIQRRTGRPLVTTFYGWDISYLPTRARWQRRLEALFQRGDLFLVEGPHMQDRLLALGCPRAKLEIQRIGIPVAAYPFRTRAPKARGQPIRVLFCASFRPKKGLPHALAAVARARETFPALELVIAGDGEQRPNVESIIRRRRMAGYTRLLGFVSHSQMIAEMNGADIFIQPSITAPDGDDEGGAPTTLLEAQACGLPVLSTFHADIPHVVLPDQSAILVPPGEPDALTTALNGLLRTPEQWAPMGTAGRALVEQQHDAQVETARLEKRYHQLVER